MTAVFGMIPVSRALAPNIITGTRGTAVCSIKEKSKSKSKNVFSRSKLIKKGEGRNKNDPPN